MIKRNPHLSKLTSNYLFLEINKRKEAYLLEHPDCQLISLGIGDTTLPMSETIVKAFMHAALDQGITLSYVGYGPEQGIYELRKKIADLFYPARIDADEVFISDGAKCDVGRLQVLFGGDRSVGVQDPSYPVYLDGSAIQGARSIHLMPCHCDNGFFPNLKELPQLDLIYICSPNNPTGVVYTRAQLEELVKYALKTKTLILFDAAYSAFIADPEIPKSIYEIEGAKKCAIEMNSFSKSAGFTGIRLGYTIVPKELKYTDGSSIHADWSRITSTLFNGASILAQKGGLAALEPNGLKETQIQVDLYRENARLLKQALTALNFEVYGADHAPYLWVRFLNMSSWDAFQLLLDQVQIVATPGSGFGASGEGFIRLSAFAPRVDILESIQRIQNKLASYATPFVSSSGAL